MAERDSLWVHGVLDQEESRVGTGAFIFPSTNAVKAKTGLRPSSGSPGQVTATGTPDANVHVAPFQAFLQDVRGTNGGVYTLTLDATKDINILSTPAHASLARNDLIIAHQADTFYGDGNSAMTVRQVVGTPSGSPADPSLASFPNNITLARVRVDAAATSIAAAKITDLRPAYTVALGGILPVASQTLRNALTGLYEGMAIYRTDRDWIEIYDGAAWEVQGPAVVSSSADLSAITNPYGGQVATRSDGGQDWVYSGSAWVCTRYRAATVLSSTTASVTFSSIPTSLKQLTLTWTARSSAATTAQNIRMRINGDTGGNYNYNHLQVTNSGVAATVAPAQTYIHIGVTGAANSAAGNFGSGTVDLVNWNRSANLNVVFSSHFWEAGATSWYHSGGGLHFAAGANTSITLLLDSGSFVSGSEFVLTGND